MTATAPFLTPCLAALLCGVGSIGAAQAQTADPQTGGLVMRFGLTLGAAAQSNRTLDINNPGNSTEIFTDLSFGISSETRTQALTFDLDGRLRTLDAPVGIFADQGLTAPSAALVYTLKGATARLNLSARYSETDLSDTSLVIDEDDTFTILTGDATRRRAVLEARHDWRQDTRARFGAFVRYEDVSYRDGVATDVDGSNLSDSQRLTFGTSATLDLSTAAELAITLSYSVFEEDGVANDRETWSLGNTLTLDRPLGDVTLRFDVTDIEEGSRLSATVGRTYETARATFSGDIGVAREVTGQTVLIGSAGINYPLPRGALSFGLSRQVASSNTQDEERLNTQVNFGYQHNLTPLSAISLEGIFAQVTDTSSDTTYRDATISATYTRTLTKNWNMDTGLRHRFSNDDGIGTARSNEVFFNLRREFFTRF